jgi:predicted phosphoribosyltransferase
MLFQDRSDAGRVLARHLRHYADRAEVVVLGLPRGGVVVAHEVAQALKAPLDIFIVRKLGAPGSKELAMGAIASGGVRVLNERVLEKIQPSAEVIEQVVAEEQAELGRRELAYRGGRPPLAVEGKTVLVIDDGLATGSTMRAALLALRRLGPARLVVGVPVGAPEACRELRALADEVVCVCEPAELQAVGRWYVDFAQVTDDEVRRLTISC